MGKYFYGDYCDAVCEFFGIPRLKSGRISKLPCQDYERAEGNCALGIGAIQDKNMDNVFYS